MATRFPSERSVPGWGMAIPPPILYPWESCQTTVPWGSLCYRSEIFSTSRDTVLEKQKAGVEAARLVSGCFSCPFKTETSTSKALREGHGLWRPQEMSSGHRPPPPWPRGQRNLLVQHHGLTVGGWCPSVPKDSGSTLQKPDRMALSSGLYKICCLGLPTYLDPPGHRARIRETHSHPLACWNAAAAPEEQITVPFVRRRN